MRGSYTKARKQGNRANATGEDKVQRSPGTLIEETDNRHVHLFGFLFGRSLTTN